MGKLILILSLSSLLAACFASRAWGSTDEEIQKRVEIEDRIESAKHMIRAGWYGFALSYTVNILSGLVFLQGMAGCDDDACVDSARFYGGISFVPVASTFMYGTMAYAMLPDPLTFVICIFSIMHALGQVACLGVAFAGHIYLRMLRKEHAKYADPMETASSFRPRLVVVPAAMGGGAGLFLSTSF